MLDLTGAGIHTTTAAGGVNFDVANTGTAQQTAWTTGSTEGFLVLDKNGNGQITGNEMFGTGMLMPDGTRAASGYAALSQYDTNHDGKIDSHDAVFKQLQVWVDANGDGKVEAGEMKSLTQLGIVSLDLHGTVSHATDHGNSVGLTSSYTTASGATHEMADVNLTKTDTTTTTTTVSTTTTTTTTVPHLSDLLAAPATDLLPGHVEHAAVSTTHAANTHAAGLVDQRLLEEEERNRNNHNPLI